MYRMKWFQTLLFCCAFISSESATLASLKLNTDQGIPQSHIYRILQDSKGFIWLCTGEGVVKYDGEQMKVYNLSTGYPFSLVNRILEVREGVFWVADYSVGLWELKDDSVRKIEFKDPNFDSPITDMAMGPLGEVVVTTNGEGGFYIFNANKATHWNHNLLPLIPELFRVAVDDNGTIFLGSLSAGLMEFKSGKVTGLKFGF